jgi:hypothetical protein
MAHTALAKVGEVHVHITGEWRSGFNNTWTNGGCAAQSTGRAHVPAERLSLAVLWPRHVRSTHSRQAKAWLVPSFAFAMRAASTAQEGTYRMT